MLAQSRNVPIGCKVEMSPRCVHGRLTDGRGCGRVGPFIARAVHRPACGWLGSRAALGASATIASSRASSVLSSSTRHPRRRVCATDRSFPPRPCCRRGSDARPPSPRASRSLRRWCGYVARAGGRERQCFGERAAFPDRQLFIERARSLRPRTVRVFLQARQHRDLALWRSMKPARNACAAATPKYPPAASP